MQEVDAAVREIASRVVEGGAHQCRERQEMRAVERSDIGEYVVAVIAGMFVALPGVDGIGARGRVQRPERLTEREIGIAGVRAEFEQHCRLADLDEPICERQMPDPGIRRHQTQRLPEHLLTDIESLQPLLHNRRGSLRLWRFPHCSWPALIAVARRPA